MDDDQLIDEALAGNSASFGLLVAKYQDRLFNTMTHVAGSPEDARDVVQDAFVKAFVKLETFGRASGFYTWLYRIAFNVAISRQRRHKPVLSIQQQREDWGHEPASGEPPPEDRLERQELAGQVQAALAKLTQEHRAIVVLRELDGCDYETIGAILDLPVGTVRSRLHRARMQLRTELKQVLQPDHS
ncbi:MAG TPA: sigma-70 family RNA polymerase sigma factor [Pirellulales bacterium]|nr:sigma-70 family RNA polymerase sigma factor [Pirellulales bacterium]